MAIHPEISLGFRPPQLAPLEIQSPLDRYQKMLTLRHLMQQGQLGQMNIEQTGLENERLRQAQQDEQAARALYAGGTEPTASELYAKVGPKTGLSIQRAQQEFQKARVEKQISDLELGKKRTERMAQLAGGIRGPEQWKSTVMQATSEELIPPEVGRQLMESGYDSKTVEQFVAQALDGVQRHNIAIADAKEKRDALLFPLQERKATADAQTAEQTATGTQPITPQQKAQAEQQLWTDPGGLIAIMNDPNRSAADKQRAAAGLEKHEGLKRAGAATTSIITPNQNIANEAKLRDDYRQDTKTYVTIRDAYNKIVGAAKSASAAGDIGLVYGFMRMQDPGSTVREGEFATAQNAGGIPERVRAMYNKAINGERLDPNVRADFVSQAEKIHSQSYADYQKTKDMYTGIAGRGGMDPQNVVIDYSTASPGGQQKKGSESPGGQKPATHRYNPHTKQIEEIR